MRLIIAGSRTFDDYDLLRKEVISFVYSQLFDPDLPISENIEAMIKFKDVTIISGTANGADKLGERFAEQFKLKVERFIPDWDKHGKRAGPFRNTEMAKNSTHCIVFTTGSLGSKNMIDTAQKFGLPLKIIWI